MTLRVTTWNLEWFGQLLQGMTRTLPRESKAVRTAAGKALQRVQIEKIAEEIRLIDPDILCLQEGPSSGQVMRLRAFCQDALAGRWTVIERPEGDKYHVRGSQGIYFLVKTTRLALLDPALLPISRWREATELESRISPEFPGEHRETWPVVHPWFKPDGTPPGLDVELRFGEDAEVSEDLPPFPTAAERAHGHFRHPQTLICTLGGKRVDFIGEHLKSKFGGEDYARAARLRRTQTPSASDRAIIEGVERIAVQARIKLTTEIVNIRHYIDHRFRTEPWPAIFVLGDFNDGVGKEYFERRHLFHDLISNLQGDVFFAQRFLNHALFDYGLVSGGKHRWSITFRDPWDPGRAPEILLDHIMFTQSVTGEQALERAAVRVRSKAGRVEHDIHEAVNATFESAADFTSDHRPVTVEMETAIPI